LQTLLPTKLDPYILHYSVTKLRSTTI